jgi:hypothetical protein
MLAKEFSMHGRPPPLKETEAREFQSETDNLTIGNSGNINIHTVIRCKFLHFLAARVLHSTTGTFCATVL